MNFNRIRKLVARVCLLLALLIGPTGVFKATSLAQDRDGDRRSRRDGDDRRDGDRNWRRDGDRNWHRGGDHDWDRDHRGYVYVPPRVYTYPRTYPYGGYYGGPYGGYYGGPYGGYYGGQDGGYYGGSGSFGYWEQKGYRDGLDRGREDARSGRYPTPNNSEHFRNGNAAYRQGFARGYQVGYGQYGGYRRF
jgi:hypothetical protein